MELAVAKEAATTFVRALDKLEPRRPRWPRTISNSR